MTRTLIAPTMMVLTAALASKDLREMEQLVKVCQSVPETRFTMA